MGVPSTIDRLPEDILNNLQELLRDPRVTQLEATARINEILADEGHADRLSKSAVNRYAMKMEKVGEKLRQSREVAKMWIGKLGATPQGELGHFLNEFLRTMAWESTVEISETEINEESLPGRVAMINKLALAMQRLEASSTMNVRREKEIRAQERERLKEETLKVVDKVAKQQGLTAEQAAFWRQEFLGV